MACPIYAITIQYRSNDGKRMAYVRPTPKPVRSSDGDESWTLINKMSVEEVEAWINTYSDYFPKRQKKEWVLARYTTKPLGAFHILQIRRVNQRDYERFTFAEIYPLFLCHMRMFVTQSEFQIPKEKQ